MLPSHAARVAADRGRVQHLVEGAVGSPLHDEEAARRARAGAEDAEEVRVVELPQRDGLRGEGELLLQVAPMPPRQLADDHLLLKV